MFGHACQLKADYNPSEAADERHRIIGIASRALRRHQISGKRDPDSSDDSLTGPSNRALRAHSTV